MGIKQAFLDSGGNVIQREHNISHYLGRFDITSNLVPDAAMQTSSEVAYQLRYPKSPTDSAIAWLDRRIAEIRVSLT